MNSYLLLLGNSCLPAITAIVLTLPLWHIRHIRNTTILFAGIIILIGAISACLISTFFCDIPGISFAAVAVSLINGFIFRHYELLLQTSRCPFCRHISLRILAQHQRTYSLYCPHCGIHTNWEK